MNILAADGTWPISSSEYPWQTIRAACCRASCCHAFAKHDMMPGQTGNGTREWLQLKMSHGWRGFPS